MGEKLIIYAVCRTSGNGCILPVWEWRDEIDTLESRGLIRSYEYRAAGTRTCRFFITELGKLHVENPGIPLFGCES